jgi:pyruvate ferredoxin oxidoreductase beta subunit
MAPKYRKDLLAPGHGACYGCGEALAMKLTMNAVGENVIVANATGCSEVFTTLFPYSAWEIPWIHSLFENAPAVASGIAAALKVLGKDKNITVVCQGGDGAMADIGFGALSGLFERGDNVLCICYDTGVYSNTGFQRSGLTPFDASTTTSPAGKYSWGNKTNQKPIPLIAMAHGIPYVAVTSVGYPRDIGKRIKKAKTFQGPKYIQIFANCTLGWKHDPAKTVEVARLAAETGLYPLFEAEHGKIVSVKQFPTMKPVEEYLKLQGRFKHLFASEEGKKQIAMIQHIADENVKFFGIKAEEQVVGDQVFSAEELASYDGREGRSAYLAYKGNVYDVTESRSWLVPGLAHYSYVVASANKGVVIDPKRDVQDYVDIACDNDFKITHILETHLHADFISGHIELAHKTGAKIVVPESACASFDYIPVKEGSELTVGKLHFCVVETPGHTPESVSYVVNDEETTDSQWMIFTGDVLFVGDVGRPDLFGPEMAKQLTAQLFESLKKLKTLDDSVLVYPCHGAGSLCGKAISQDPYSSIGREKKTNYAFKPETAEEFEKVVLEDMPAAP